MRWSLAVLEGLEALAALALWLVTVVAGRRSRTAVVPSDAADALSLPSPFPPVPRLTLSAPLSPYAREAAFPQPVDAATLPLVRPYLLASERRRPCRVPELEPVPVGAKIVRVGGGVRRIAS